MSHQAPSPTNVAMVDVGLGGKATTTGTEAGASGGGGGGSAGALGTGGGGGAAAHYTATATAVPAPHQQPPPGAAGGLQPAAGFQQQQVLYTTDDYIGINFGVPATPWSAAMNNVIRSHQSHQKLLPELKAAALRSKKGAIEGMAQHLICPDYDSLAASLMHDTEAHIAPGGLFLEFDSVKMLARRGITEPFAEVDQSMLNGRLLLTNSRVLALSSAPVPIGTVTRQGPSVKTNKRAWDDVWYNVKYRSADNIVFRPYNLAQFTHLQLHVAVASTTVEVVKAPKPCGGCCFCCLCDCCACAKKWRSYPGHKILENDRTFDLYVTNGPWSPGTAVKMTVQVKAHEPFSKIQQFLSMLQAIAPNLASTPAVRTANATSVPMSR